MDFRAVNGNASSLLEAVAVSASYGARIALENVSLKISAGERVALLGPNGAGKTTLLRLMGGLLSPRGGSINLRGRDLADWPARARARVIAGVPQTISAPMPLRVADVVATGRLPHAGDWAALGKDDDAAISAALDAVDMKKFSDRLVDQLSAGERQRAWLAMALAQQPELLLLDEPTAHLDIHQAWHLMDLLAAWADEKKLAVVMSSHDLNLAAEFCSRVLLLRDGRVFADGAPVAVLTAANLREVFGHPLDVQIIDGKPRIWPVKKQQKAEIRSQRSDFPAAGGK